MMKVDKTSRTMTISFALRTTAVLFTLVAAMYIVVSFLKPDRPMFSDKFEWRDNLIPRWTEAALFSDKAGNWCAVDIHSNSILICMPTSKPPVVGIVNVRGVPGEPYFVATYQSTRIDEQPMWSKSIRFLNQPNTAHMLSDDFSFDLRKLRPGAAVLLRNSIIESIANGSKLDDFVEFTQSNTIDGKKRLGADATVGRSALTGKPPTTSTTTSAAAWR